MAAPGRGRLELGAFWQVKHLGSPQRSLTLKCPDQSWQVGPLRDLAVRGSEAKPGQVGSICLNQVWEAGTRWGPPSPGRMLSCTVGSECPSPQPWQADILSF